MVEYDFIVIGAGSAGAVVANRLTEIDEWSVLLLEAGGEETVLGQVPSLAADLQLSENDWQYKTVVLPSQACLAMIDKRCQKSFIQNKSFSFHRIKQQVRLAERQDARRHFISQLHAVRQRKQARL